MLDRDAYCDADGSETRPARCPECGFVWWELFECPDCGVPLEEEDEE
jgi:predicted RNA-binding Zn-ribbon protein involved in translation (DUF1610 family)